MTARLTVLDHPVASGALTTLRDRSTGTAAFRLASDQLCGMLVAAAVDDLGVHRRDVSTPLTVTQGAVPDEQVILLPVLRAGISMLASALRLLPEAPVGFAGLARDEETAVAGEYYWKMPPLGGRGLCLILDPMLATGGSVEHVLRKLAPSEGQRVTVVSVIAAPEGIERVQRFCPKVRIITASVDERLDERKYIVPGLGDYGDRYFGSD